MNDVTVSVVVPTLDSAAVIGRCLASVQRQRGVTLETIVVDQDSRDGTSAIARAAGAKVLSLPRPRVYGLISRSRNLGARHAAGSYLLHLDADMELTPGVLASCVLVCERGRHLALVIHEEDLARGYWARCKALERRCYKGSTEMEGARFVRADAFWAVGGYDEGLGSSEDWDIHRRYARMGSIGDIPQPIIHHVGRLGLRQQLRKKFAYGRTSGLYLEKHGASAPAAGMLRAYARSWRTLVGDPMHAAGFIALRVSELSALCLGMAFEAIMGRVRIHRASARDGSR